MGRLQRQKGKRGEREAVHQLKSIGCLSAARRVRNSEGDSDIIEAIPGVSFEVKLEKRTNLPAAMRQAIAQAANPAGLDEIPAVLHRETVGRGEPANPWCLTIRLADLPPLLHAYQLALANHPPAP